MTTTFRFHGWISFALLVLGGLLSMAFRESQQALPMMARPPGDSGVLRVAYTQDMAPDPHQRMFPLAQQNQFALSLWEPLVECDPLTGEPQPAAAASWEWSADQLSLTLRLSPDARWSNGDPVTASDFVRAWIALLGRSREVAATLFPLRNAEAYHEGQVTDASVVGVHALDDLTLRLELERPRSTLVAELADPLLSPWHRTSEKVLASRAYISDPTALVTNGPFHLVQANADGFRLAVDANFHGRAGVRLAGVQFLRVDDLAMAPLLVEAGVVDLLTPTPFARTGNRLSNRRIKLESELALAVNSLDLNVTRGPLRDVRVRRALALAVDRAGPIRMFDSGARLVPARSWVPDMPGRDGLDLMHEDVTEARRLLATAGYPGGAGFPILTLALPLALKDDPFPAAWCERWYQALGIRTHITYEPPAVRQQRLKGGDYDVLYGQVIATVPDAGDLLSVFLMPPSSNNMMWTDPAVVTLLTEANTLTGRKRLEKLAAAERTTLEVVPTIPMLFLRRQTMQAEEVKGWYADPLARQSLKRLWLEAAEPADSRAESRL